MSSLTIWDKSKLSHIQEPAVDCFGVVEFLHPAFHNEKHIWPRGYKATSLVKCTAADKVPAKHVCEILDSPTGSGPLFRLLRLIPAPNVHQQIVRAPYLAFAYAPPHLWRHN